MFHVRQWKLPARPELSRPTFHRKTAHKSRELNRPARISVFWDNSHDLLFVNFALLALSDLGLVPGLIES
jgi:hypothetical protein